MKKRTLFELLDLQLKKWWQLLPNQQQLTRKVCQAQPGVKAKKPPKVRRERTSALLILAVVLLTIMLGHRFANQPRLDEGTIAPETIRAPKAAQIVDTKTTAQNRQIAWRKAEPILVIDSTVNQKIWQKLQTNLTQGERLRQLAGNFPFTTTTNLSTAAQIYLRSCPDSQWQKVLAFLRDAQSRERQQNAATTNFASVKIEGFENEAMAQAARELNAYRLKTAKSHQFSMLMAKLSQVRQQYAQALSQLAQLQKATPPTLYESSWLDLSDPIWSKTVAGIRATTQRILAQGVYRGISSDTLQTAVNLQVRSHVPPQMEPLATQMLLTVLEPNLKEDEAQTKLAAAEAVAKIAPQMLNLERGEVIVRKGETIDHAAFITLDYFGLSRRGIGWSGLSKFGGIVSVAVGIFVWIAWKFERQKLRQRDCVLILLLALSTPLLLRLNLRYINLPAVGLLLGSFYGFPIGGTVVGLLGLLVPVGMDISGKSLLTGLAGGMLASWMAGWMRSREELALIGVAVSVTQGLAYLLGKVVLSAIGTDSVWNWYDVALQAGLFSLAGIVWSAIAIGISPYLEHFFDLVTPIRLAELANPNRPLLKRLATEAPGTFQHTLFVSTLAEAAARVLGCNVELVRTGTLYHDIGKLHDPLAFIENQMGGVNKHDEINDPWESAAIIRKHVTEGLVMARKCRLPMAIQAFIPEHQGTMAIAYFYHQAQQIARQDHSITVDERDFCYAGPAPQSRETALVMLADSCEAALRTLPAAGKSGGKEPTREEALAMVQKILRSRWQDNQLVDSGLTRADMDTIAETFVNIWQQFHHKRIAYPKRKE
ncbi:HD family phosphohydrolase [Chroococcidiopsis thermalis]|uniref:Metal dependent phosphohydrolase n=1 Tax=Chroococcidiopsis thermalis (strain PCC 7203) TaxID=251229 RepID=K9U1P6_CHRTP|nr:HDIG domain-containing metalloprotein [Chroococcidiopsis thermalis]AFY88543.1 metal dependent phosphohydrolase [Chroococcidiopsis thermalis PCC 7203]